MNLAEFADLTGFDWDESKIGTARIAATNDASYSVTEIQSAPIPETDTILIVDVLHYLPLADQDELLARAAASLRNGGRLIVREVDSRRTLSSAITQWFERLSIHFNFNRGGAMTFRSRQQQCDALRCHGFTVMEMVAMPGFTLDNVLLLATRSTTDAP